MTVTDADRSCKGIEENRLLGSARWMSLEAFSRDVCFSSGKETLDARKNGRTRIRDVGLGEVLLEDTKQHTK